MTNIQAIDLLKGLEQSLDDYYGLNDEGKTAFHMAITALELFGNTEQLPSAQPERTVYENMSDEQFEEWLYEHGICHPDIHESIPCSAVPLLIDNAINELLPQEHEIILCKDCKHRPTRDEDGWLDFPTERCPCQNGDDFYYSWMPDDNWFCGNAERRE